MIDQDNVISSRTTAGSLTIGVGLDNLLVLGSIIQFLRYYTLTAVLLSKKTWGDAGSSQVNVLGVRGTQHLCQWFIARMTIIDEHATLIELLKLWLFRERQGGLKQLQEGMVSRLGRFGGEAGDHRQSTDTK